MLTTFALRIRLPGSAITATLPRPILGTETKYLASNGACRLPTEGKGWKFIWSLELNKKTAKFLNRWKACKHEQQGKLTGAEKLIHKLWKIYQQTRNPDAKLLIDGYSQQCGQWRPTQYTAARRLIKNQEATHEQQTHEQPK